jgi:hypothetical protein
MLHHLPSRARLTSAKPDGEEAVDHRQWTYSFGGSGAGAVHFTVIRTSGANVYELCFRDAIDRHIGLKFRSAEVERRIRARTRAIGRHQWNDATHRLSLEVEPDSQHFDKYCNTVSAELAAIAFRPFTPRLLVSALAITNRERLRWTKDGRLRTSGSVTIRCSQLINVPTYEVRLVEELIANPSIINGWRNDDRCAGMPARQPTG